MPRVDVPRGTSIALTVLIAAGALSAVLVWGEIAHARTHARQERELAPERARTARVAEAVGGRRDTPARCAVLVLGFADRGPRAHAVNRWRARIGARTAARLVAEGFAVEVVACGGAVRGAVPEAELLAQALREAGWQGRILLEGGSTTTWENIASARALVGDLDAISICSNGLHAEKARAYLRRQDPDLGSRLVSADDYRFPEMSLLKPVFAVVGSIKLRQLRRTDTHG